MTPLIDNVMIRLMCRAIDRAEARGFETSPPLIESGKLKLLFAGYTGANNMGADVRVEEMLRQFRHLFGPDRLAATVFSFGKPKWKGYFGDAERLRPELHFPRYLSRLVPQFDGVVACEGSTFKSNFTDLLPAMMIGALGLASAGGRLSVAYGSEAGKMTPQLSRMLREYCGKSYVIARNEQSRDLLSQFGLAADVGTDTAWTFESLPREYGETELRKKGWNGEPILMVCPINPFWWPVNISLAKRLALCFGFYKDSYYGRVFFHQCGAEIDRKFEAYLRSLAEGVSAFCQRHHYFPVVAACERLDRTAMERLSAMLGGAPTFNSFDYEPRKFVSILRCANLMLSSRYHAVVTTMPAGVVSAGISMDERLDNLFADRGHPEFLMRVDDSELASRIGHTLEFMHHQQGRLQEEIESCVWRHLRKMSHMGRLMVEHVQSRYAEFEDLPPRRSWEQYLPAFGENLESLASRTDRGDDLEPMPVVSEASRFVLSGNVPAAKKSTTPLPP